MGEKEGGGGGGQRERGESLRETLRDGGIGGSKDSDIIVPILRLVVGRNIFHHDVVP
jgi:hypothetical protein